MQGIARDEALAYNEEHADGQGAVGGEDGHALSAGGVRSVIELECSQWSLSESQTWALLQEQVAVSTSRCRQGVR